MRRSEPIFTAAIAGLGLFWLVAMMRAAPPTPPGFGATLHVSATNVVDLCMVNFTPYPPAPEGTGGGEITTNLYSGPAWILSADDLPEAGMLIECSTDLESWIAFPQAGFQLTLFPSNALSVVTVPEGSPQMFFRGKVAQ